MLNIRTAYLDSCFFISVISPVYWRLPTLVPMLRAIDAGHLKVITSTITIGEVRRYRDVYESYVDEHQAAAIRRMFESGTVVVLPLTEFIAFWAAEIGNDYPDLLPMDCMHIATAEYHKADVLFTFDGEGKGRRRPEKMIYYDNQIGDPPMRISEPFLPMGEMFDLDKLNNPVSLGAPKLEDIEIPMASEKLLTLMQDEVPAATVAQSSTA